MNEENARTDIPLESTGPLKAEWARLKEGRTEREKDIRRIVSAIPLFRDLSRNDWRELSNLFHLREFTDGEIIFEISTPGLGMYIIIEGQVRIVGEQNGEEIEFAQLGPGDFFGEMSLIDDAPRSASAISVGETRLIGIFRPQLKQLMYRRPKLGVALMERLAGIVAARLRAANEHWEKKGGESR